MKGKYYIITLGCQKNEYDSQLISALLKSCGYEKTEEITETDILVINTCSIRDKADVKVYGRLGQYRELKKLKPNLITIVSGCLAQKDGKKLLGRFPNVNIVVGPRNISSIPYLVEYVQRTGKRRALCELGDMNFEVMPVDRDRSFSAWIPVTEGCDNRCTYCIVPYVRGAMVSRPLEHIMKEAEEFVNSGGLEITLLGQNVNAYGKDKPEYGSFNDILKKINNLKGIERIRFMSPHPANFDDKFVETMASLEHVCRHIHLPLQSGDDTILRRMGRRYTTQDYASIVEKLRQAMPEIAITTDIIVGFPGETNEQFENTMSFVKQMNFDGAFMFAYSEREGTPAVKINPSVPPQERLDRLNKLIEMQNNITFEKHKKLEGSEALVLVETLSKKDGEFVTGKTDKKTVVNFTGDSSLIGKIVKVKLEKAFTWGFMGKFISD